MTTTSSIASSSHPSYSRSFVSYEIPFRPDDPVEFADTEGLRSFYAAFHDPAGRVVRFDKIRLVRREEPQEVQLPEAGSPGTVVYFEVTRDPITGEPEIGKPISYAETEHLDRFFVGQVSPSGRTSQVSLLHKEIAFSDAYEYGPTGELKKRTMTRPGLSGSGDHSDRNGDPLTKSIPEPENLCGDLGG